MVHAGDSEATTTNPTFTMIFHKGDGEYPVASTPFNFSAFGRHPASAPPRLGEHTAEILTEVLGMSAHAAEQLQIDGVVGEVARG